MEGDGAERGGRAERGRQHNRPVRPADEPVLRYTLFRLIFFLGTLLFIAKVLAREGPRSLGVFIPDSHWFLLSPLCCSGRIRVFLDSEFKGLKSAHGRVPRGRQRIHASLDLTSFLYIFKWILTIETHSCTSRVTWKEMYRYGERRDSLDKVSVIFQLNFSRINSVKIYRQVFMANYWNYSDFIALTTLPANPRERKRKRDKRIPPYHISVIMFI